MYLILYSVLKLYIKGTLPYTNKDTDQFHHCFRFILHSQVSNLNFYFIFLNLSTLLRCINLEISPWWRLKKGGWYKAFIQIGSTAL